MPCVVSAFVIGLYFGGVVGVAVAFSIVQCIIRLPAAVYCFHGSPVQLADLGAGNLETICCLLARRCVNVPCQTARCTRLSQCRRILNGGTRILWVLSGVHDNPSRWPVRTCKDICNLFQIAAYTQLDCDIYIYKILSNKLHIFLIQS